MVSNMMNSPALSWVYNKNWSDPILNQSSNLSYVVRNVYRLETSVPETRMLDYTWRDYSMMWVGAILFELAFRLADTLFIFPQMTKTLELHKLKELYEGKKNGNHPEFKSVRDYNNIPEFLKARMTGSAVRNDSNYLLPKLIEDVDIPALQKKGAKPEQIEELKTLAYHLRRKLNFNEHLDTMVRNNTLTQADATTVRGHLDKFGKELDALPKKIREEIKQQGGKKIDFQAFDTNLMAGIEKLKNRMYETVAKQGQTVEHLVREGIDSKLTTRALKEIQTFASWPKLITNTALYFVFLGLLFSKVDNDFIQPWQTKLVKKHGDADFVRAPAYIATGVGLAAFVPLMRSKTLGRALGYVGHFVASSVLAYGAYLGTAYALINKKSDELSRTQTLKPADPANASRSFTVPNSFRKLDVLLNS